jgi:hypothetical protein
MMEVQDLIREKVFAETIAERDKLILDLFMENQQLKERLALIEREKIEEI